MTQPGWLCALAAYIFLTVFSSPACAGDADELYLFVNSREFDVAVAPADDASKNADNSILYQKHGINDEWTALGPCRKITRDDGQIRFTREVKVERDGIYLYTSRPIVGGEVQRPPEPDDPPQASVVVDTLPPIATITRPEDDFSTTPGKPVTLAWEVTDEHLGDKPVALTYSGDGGRSWNKISRDLPAAGSHDWIIPPDLTGPALIRVAAIDLAGNVGRALRGLESAPPPQTAARPDAPAAGTPADPEPEYAAGNGDETEAYRDPNASWLYYLMALNLMRQNKPADALQYYWLSVREDPQFVNAWADIALAYNDLGAHKTAREVTEKARELAPDRIDLMHMLGETYHAEGMERLAKARTAEERLEAKAAIDQAVAWYGKALDTAAEEWKLAAQAASFYRLGEICYYVNLDPEGARAYWEKILKLHIPTPNPDLMQWSSRRDKLAERRRHERNTDQWVTLHTWQNWARGYLEQMNERERQGIVELMKAQRINRARTAASRAQSLPYGPNDMAPGREDGRSLFSLSNHLGSPDDVAACVGTAGESAVARRGAGIGGQNEINFPAHMNRPPLTEGYRFYAGDERGRESSRPRIPQRPSAGKGLFSTPSGIQPPPPADPYAFPAGGQGTAPWNSPGAYGNRPVPF